MNATEVECPICDRKIQSDIKECPNCGAELSLSNFEDLEEVAIKLSKSDIQKPLEAKVDSKEPSHGVELKVEEMKSEPLETEKKKELRLLEKPQKEEKVTIDPNKDESRHGFGRLFGKKKNDLTLCKIRDLRMSELRVRKRRRLREKEVRGLAEELLVSTGLSIFKIGDTVDIAESPEYRVIIFENQIIGFLQDGKAFLTIRGLLKHPITKSFVTVDMGAIKFVINGADVMGPGIVDADDDIQIGDFVWVRDENNKKPLAVGQALITGTEMKEKKPGKAIKSVLFVGDKLWKFDER